MKVEIKFEMDIDSKFIDELKKIVNHHMEAIIDLDSYPEIESIYNAECKIIE